MSRVVRFEKDKESKVSNAGGYIRVSHRDQVKDGLSLENQEQAIKQFCEAKGYKLNPQRIYRDEGRSAYVKTKRPGLKAIMDDVQNKRIDVVVVYSISRFYRNTSKLLKDLETMQKYNVAFISITENFDTSTPIGKATLSILGAIAEMESSQKSVVVKQAKRIRAQKYGYNGTVTPRGYRKVYNDDRKVIPPYYKKAPKSDPDHKKIVKLFDMYKRNEGMYRIGKRLGFSRPHINYILKNPIYCGLITYNLGSDAIIKQGGFKPYISISQYNANQRRRRRNNCNPKRKSPSFTIHKKNGQFYLRELP